MTDRDIVRVLTIGPAPAGPDSRGGMATVLTLMAAHPDPKIRVRVVPTYADRSFTGRLVLGVRGMLVSTMLVLAGHVDVLHVHLAHGGSVVRKSLPLLAARLRGTATIVHAHSYDFAGWFDGLPSWGQAVVRRSVAADRWLVLADHHVAEFSDRLRMPAGRFQVMHNPVQLPGAGATAGQPAGVEPVRAVSLGRLGRRKGSYDVIAAVALLSDDVRARLRVVLAGDGELDDVRRAAAMAGVDDVVEVRGWQEPAARDQLMRQSQIFLLPSYEEGLPMAMLEAMARGLAPIVTPVGGIPQVVGDGVEGLLVQPGDAQGLSKAIRRLVEDDSLRTEMASAAFSRSKHFDVAQWHENLTELWIDLARQPARQRR